MNTKSKAEITRIKKAFEDLLKPRDKNEEVEHVAQMISFAFLSEIEKMLDSKKLNKKALAGLADVSASYITQLYRGSKMVNMTFLARVATSLNIRFQISAVDAAQQHDLDEKSIQENEEAIIEILNRKESLSGCWLYHKHYEHMDAVYDTKASKSARNLSLPSVT